jgi:hypothetical protein
MTKRNFARLGGACGSGLGDSIQRLGVGGNKGTRFSPANPPFSPAAAAARNPRLLHRLLPSRRSASAVVHNESIQPHGLASRIWLIFDNVSKGNLSQKNQFCPLSALVKKKTTYSSKANQRQMAPAWHRTQPFVLATTYTRAAASVSVPLL